MSKADKIIEQIIEELNTPNYVPPDDIPNIDLYMDQITTFMNKHLDGCKRTPDDKILTKTMINNYAKNNLLPSPEKKKYSENHLIILIFIYYLKGFLSISDIQALIKPLIDEHYNTESELSLKDIYKTLFKLEKQQISNWQEELSNLNDLSKTVFTGEKDEETLQTFALICLLSFEVYMRKRTIEKMIDDFVKPTTLTDSKKEKKEKRKKESSNE